MSWGERVRRKEATGGNEGKREKKREGDERTTRGDGRKKGERVR